MHEWIKEWDSILASQSLPPFPFLWLCKLPTGMPNCNSVLLSKKRPLICTRRWTWSSNGHMNLTSFGSVTKWWLRGSSHNGLLIVPACQTPDFPEVDLHDFIAAFALVVYPAWNTCPPGMHVALLGLLSNITFSSKLLVTSSLNIFYHSSSRD